LSLLALHAHIASRVSVSATNSTASGASAAGVPTSGSGGRVSSPEDTHAALADIRAVLLRLGILGEDLTTEQYTDAVLARRG
jgi:hypothetical protein